MEKKMLKKTVIIFFIFPVTFVFSYKKEKDFYYNVVKIAGQSIGLKTIPSVKGKRFTNPIIPALAVSVDYR